MPIPTFNPDNVTMMDSMTGEIPYEQAQGIITQVKTGSAFMKLAKAVPMTKPIQRYQKMSGIGAYWVSETERIKTSKPEWLDVEMRAYKLGVIVPVSRETLDYSVTNFMELMKPEIAEAFAKKFDGAVLTNVDNPYSNSILKSATDAGNSIVETNNKYNDINTAMGKIEGNDMTPNGIATLLSQLTKYRATKDVNGMPIFNSATTGGVDNILGLPISYMPKDALGDSGVLEIVGDWNNAQYGILKNIEYKILDQAVLTTLTASDGNPVSLAERDMYAIRAIMEVGFMILKDGAFSVITKPVTP